MSNGHVTTILSVPHCTAFQVHVTEEQLEWGNLAGNLIASNQEGVRQEMGGWEEQTPLYYGRPRAPSCNAYILRIAPCGPL